MGVLCGGGLRFGVAGSLERLKIWRLLLLSLFMNTGSSLHPCYKDAVLFWGPKNGPSYQELTVVAVAAVVVRFTSLA